MCQEFSRCYNDVNICLWSNGSLLTQSDAQAACQQRNSFLPRITNNDIQYKLGLFRSEDKGAYNLLETAGFWVDVTAADISNFQWIDGSSLAG